MAETRTESFLDAVGRLLLDFVEDIENLEPFAELLIGCLVAIISSFFGGLIINFIGLALIIHAYCKKERTKKTSTAACSASPR